VPCLHVAHTTATHKCRLPATALANHIPMTQGRSASAPPLSQINNTLFLLLTLDYRRSISFPYAAAVPAFWKNLSSSSLTMSFNVEQIPCGAPGTTFKIAPLTIFEDNIAAAPIGTI
jgi:hypothetical protein